MLTVLEGLDGAGKSTQVKKLRAYLESLCGNLEYIHFPRYDAPVYGDLISRELDREVFNLGFSGNAKLDIEIAEYMASVKDPGVFVLDYAPNCKADLIEAKAEKFFRLLRDAHPDVPVIIIEPPYYPKKNFDRAVYDDFAQRIQAQRSLYKKLKKSGEKKLFYIKSDQLLNGNMDATVDGVHYTDLGSVIHAEAIVPVIRRALRMTK